MTKEERYLRYDFLKGLETTVHRQKVFGKYIVDFYITEAKIVMEPDGTQHYEDAGIQKDKERDASLSSLGLTVLRYSNTDVMRNFTGVCQDILARIHAPY